MRVERVAQRRFQPAVDLDDVQVGDPRRQVLGQDAEPAADLERDIVRPKLGRVADQPQDVVVDEEVLAELAVRPHVEAPQAVDAALAHQPKTRAALRSTIASSSAYSTPRRPATSSAVWVTLAGSFGSPRSGTGVR